MSTLSRRQIQTVQLLAQNLDIGMNANPLALFDARGGCINIWCTPQDNPGGVWRKITMTAGAHCKPSEFVGTISWSFDDEIQNIVAIKTQSTAYALQDQFPRRFNKRGAILNRRDDLKWVKQKALWLFRQAQIDLEVLGVPIVTESNS